MTAVTSALSVLIPAGAHPVTATLSPTTNGASVPAGRLNFIAPDAFATDIVCTEATLSLKTVGVFWGTNKLLSSVAVGLVPTSTNASPPCGVTLR